MTDVVWSASVADEPGRTPAEILYAEPTPEERRKARREQAGRDELAARAQVAADSAETHGWLSRLRGQGMPSAADVLARAQRDDGPDRSDAARLHAARRVLREHGLDEVLDGGRSGVLLDANMGTLEAPGSGSLSRSAPTSELDDPRIQRSLAQLRGADAVIARAQSRRRREIARSRSAGAPHGAPSGRHGPGSGCGVCQAVYDASPIPPWARTS